MTEVHHASLIRTNSVADLEINNLGSNFEIQDIYLESFGIADARDLLISAYKRPVETEFQLLIVRTDFITLEAQNALLKLLEEPPISTKLVLVIPNDLILLATLNSRLQLDNSYQTKDEALNESFKEFIALDYKARIALIDEANKKKNVAWQRLIKKGLTNYLCQPALKTLPKPELEYVVRNLLTRGASNKMLLEHAALILPARLTE